MNTELGIVTIEDLLTQYPFRYIDRTRFHKIGKINPNLPYVQVIGRLSSLQWKGQGKGKRLVGSFNDDTGSMELIWFQGATWLYKQLEPGKVYVAWGRPSLFNQQISINHPEMDLFEGNKGRGIFFQPVYRSTEKLKRVALDSKGIQKLVRTALSYGMIIPDYLPDYLRERYNLMSRQTAIQQVHFPETQILLDKSVHRLKFEELFLMQLEVLNSKILRQKKVPGPIFKRVGASFHEFYHNRLPFSLTSAQQRVLKEIRRDTLGGVQMNRLLQGDVGSGKTIVALMSMLIAIDDGYQACLMAPTEILAQQHFQGIFDYLEGSGVTVTLLTGTSKAKDRKVIHNGLRSGNIDILIGTHALLEDSVKFDNLGLAIIDEQHRFGVEQRSKLWKKNDTPPHMLVMTATPIPRTLAMSLYGDLDVSIIDELPQGRKPIKTLHFFESARLRVFGLMREEMAKGRQIYLVYPLIEESEKTDLLYLQAGVDSLIREFPRPDYQIGMVHGRLTAQEKESEMERFVAGKTQILVATTVIEVGVNVPNATVMIIENAERFGLSQLHQLRGRVGRGGAQSYCILMSKDKLSQDGKARLETMVQTTDGFKIAEVDLQLRGPGNLAGTRQSGLIEFKLADLAVDQELLSIVRDEVVQIFKADPRLSLGKNSMLRTYLHSSGHDIGWEKIS